MNKIILLSQIFITIIAFKACANGSATSATAKENISFYDVPLVCPAAPQIGCGSQAEFYGCGSVPGRLGVAHLPGPRTNAALDGVQRYISGIKSGAEWVCPGPEAIDFGCAQCRWGDSNSHRISPASPSSWCVCQFRHIGEGLPAIPGFLPDDNGCGAALARIDSALPLTRPALLLTRPALIPAAE